MNGYGEVLEEEAVISDDFFKITKVKLVSLALTQSIPFQ